MTSNQCSTNQCSKMCNIGGVDRTLRIAIGVVLIGLAVSDTISWWGYLGVIPLLTGFFRFCPAYLPFGIRTCKKTDPS